jgi:hypothetical protein
MSMISRADDLAQSGHTIGRLIVEAILVHTASPDKAKARGRDARAGAHPVGGGRLTISRIVSRAGRRG